MELTLEKNNNINLEKSQQNFLETNIGKIINTTLDIGLKYLLPDIIENEVINIKDTLIKEGWEKGLKKIIEEGINIGKSAIGIFTGNFENIDQIKKTVENGGIIDSASSLLDNILNRCSEKGLINKKVKSAIVKGKDILIDNISSNLEDMLEEQNSIFKKMKDASNNWKSAYMKRDFSLMSKEFDILEKNISKVVPIETLIKDIRKIENIHNVIKNNGGNFDLTNTQLEVANILIK